MGEENKKTLRFESLRELVKYLEQTGEDIIVSVIIESRVGRDEAEV